ncbi:neurotrophin-7 [Xyrauchen texanus]|uniref:neurotrophin-7 n=1 Tax=Xyrauchen texanus TaxID=154827 RepID=UPI0022429A60|nr:neurotrophin-7 [Xyrauchen texanus]
MRSLTLVLLFLISVQDALNLGGYTQAHWPANQHAATEQAPGPRSQSKQDDDLIPNVNPKLFNKHRYRSSRVLFSDVIPTESETGGSRHSRVRRRANEFLHRGEYSVCESEEHWVENLTHATDMAGNEVTVLSHFQIDKIKYKQLFHETTCRVSKPSTNPGQGASGVKTGTSTCLGIDNKHWNSYCTNTHTFVRALISYKKKNAWRLIRINTACVCVLSHKSWSNGKY